MQKSPWNSGNSYEAEPKDGEAPEYSRIFWGIVIILILCVFYLGIEAIAHKARAHVEGHPEWNDVLMESRNGYGGRCCGYGDAKLLDFDQWEATKGGYRVELEGEWYNVPPKNLTQNVVNPTGKAVVWYAGSGGGLTIYCFRPLNTY